MAGTRAKRAAKAEPAAADERRGRILHAAFRVLMEQGYAAASTAEIAARARVSKRELYTLFGNKQGIIRSLIETRTATIQVPLAVPALPDRAALARTLEAFGFAVLKALTDPTSTALQRLAILEGERAPEIARSIDQNGREPLRHALTAVLAAAQSRHLIGSGEPVDMVAQYFALLFGDLPFRLLLGVIKPPAAAEMRRRAATATAALFALHDLPD